MIYIVFDTNSIEIKFDKSKEEGVYNHFAVHSALSKAVAHRDSMNAIDDIEILLPELVVDEIVEHKVEQYCDDIAELNQILRKLGREKIEPIKKETYRNTCRNQIKEYCMDKGITIVPICSCTYLNKIVNRAILKMPPFEGKDGKSDKGFKDTLIYYSLIEYSLNNKGKYYLVTKDGIFFDKKNINREKQLRLDFYSETGSKLLFFDDIDLLISRLSVFKSDNYILKLEYKENTVECEHYLYNNKDNKKYIPFEYKSVRPIFEETCNIAKVINDELNFFEERTKEYVNNYKIPYDEYICDVVFKATLSYSIKKNENGLLSIIISECYYLGGPHESTSYHTYNYDLNEGRLLSLKDFLKGTKNEISLFVSECVEMDKQQNMNKYMDSNYQYINAFDTMFYIEEDTIHIMFNEYELAPYSSGMIDLELCKIGDKKFNEFREKIENAKG